MIPWLNHIVVYTLENRSFDQLLGQCPGVAGFGPDIRLAGPDGNGVSSFPMYRYSGSQCANPTHTWVKIHEAWNQGGMDGFVKANGPDVMGYFPITRFPAFIKAVQEGIVLDRYFSSVLGPTMPNRLYQIAGTSHGLRDDPPIFGSDQFHMPTLFDQLSRHRVAWTYYIGDYGLGSIGRTIAKQALFCPLLWFPRFLRRPLNRHLMPLGGFFRDVQTRRLPAVSFLAPRYLRSAHPPFPVQWGLASALHVLRTLRSSPLWKNTLYILQFDEAGGFFDPVPPPIVDSFGLGIRVPAVLWSGRAEPGVCHTVFDHTSVLRFIEEQYELPLLGERTAQMASLALALV